MLSCEVVSSQALGRPEVAAWADMMARFRPLQRAFLTPTFAAACHHAYGRAYVAVVHSAGKIRAFLPFQFRSKWHYKLRLAERIGGELCDNAGLIAEPGFRVEPGTLLALCGLGGLFITHLGAEQDAFGLAASTRGIGHRIDLSAGAAGYFAMLRTERKGFVQDTERRLRRSARQFGTLRFDVIVRPGAHVIAELIAMKRQQYRRTQVADPFADPRRLRLVEGLAEMASEECEPLLTQLTANGRILAQHLGLRHAGVLSYWFPVYDPAARQISPGRLLLWHTIERADELGITLVDRGEGDSEAKRDFSTGTVEFGQASYFATTVRARLARLYQAAEWRWERARPLSEAPEAPFRMGASGE